MPYIEMIMKEKYKRKIKKKHITLYNSWSHMFLFVSDNLLMSDINAFLNETNKNVSIKPY